MIVFDSQTIILAIIGSVGIIATGVVLTYSFKRNRSGKGNYQ
jgi:hypothetical protein